MELRLLRMIFTLDQAELSFRLRLPFETVEEIAARTGVPQQGLKLQIMPMSRAGQAFTAIMGGTRYFKMLPWVFGTYEMQCHRMDREFAEINAQYAPHFSRQFFAQAPALMQVLPVEAELSEKETPLPYERVSALLEAGQSFLVDDCIRKKEQALLGQPCDRPLQVCLAVAPIPGVFDSAPQGRSLSRAEAYALLEYAEAMGLVHLTSNVQQGGFYICNCCPCCCRVLRAITRLGMPASEVVSAHYRTEIDRERCAGCGRCAGDRCPVGAIEAGEAAHRVRMERCIGCGLCATTCLSGAIRLFHREHGEWAEPPANEAAWLDERGQARGVDFSAYR